MKKDVGDVIREQRERLGMSQAELARRVNIAQPSLHNIEIGRTKRSRYLPEIYNELGIDPRTQQPLEGRVSSTGNHHRESMAAGVAHDFPVYYMQPSTEGVEMAITADPVETVERPALLGSARDSFGLCVYGDDMSPAYKAGDIVFVHPYQPPIIGADVVLRSADIGDLRVVLGELIGVTNTDWVIKQHKEPDKKLKYNRKEWSRCDRIIGKWNRR